MTTFTEDHRNAHTLLTQLIEHTAPEYLDAHFPMEWSHEQIAEAILRRHTADILIQEGQQWEQPKT